MPVRQLERRTLSRFPLQEESDAITELIQQKLDKYLRVHLNVGKKGKDKLSTYLSLGAKQYINLLRGRTF